MPLLLAVYYFASGLIFGVICLAAVILLFVAKLGTNKDTHKATPTPPAPHRPAAQPSPRASAGKSASVPATSGSAAAMPAHQFKPELRTAAESSVWFSAFCGRMYRDFVASPACHAYFKERMERLLNKHERPAFIDPFELGDLRFAEDPPLLTNIQWVPIAAPEDGDPYFDVVCTADLAFESPNMSFAVSTTVWINWPREHFASVPITLTLEVAQICGKVRFGVERGGSFLSFLEEPRTEFVASSALGQLSNVPLVPELLVRALKKHISEKMVHPGKHRFKLMWPRFWWPLGVEDEQVGVSEASRDATLEPAQLEPRQLVESAGAPAVCLVLARRHSVSDLRAPPRLPSARRRRARSACSAGSVGSTLTIDELRLLKKQLGAQPAKAGAKREAKIWGKLENAREFMSARVSSTIAKVRREVEERLESEVLAEGAPRKPSAGEEKDLLADPLSIRSEELKQIAVGIMQLGKSRLTNIKKGIFSRVEKAQEKMAEKPTKQGSSDSSSASLESSQSPSPRFKEGYLRGPSSRGEVVWVVAKLRHLSLYKDRSDAADFQPPAFLINLQGSSCLRQKDGLSFELRLTDEWGKERRLCFWAEEAGECAEWTGLLQDFCRS